MLSLIKRQEQDSVYPSCDDDGRDKLVLTEASLLDLSDDELFDVVKDVEAVVCCLGHEGVFSHPRRLVLDSVKRLSAAMIRADRDQEGKGVHTPKKLIVMSAAGVPNPDGTDDPRRFIDRLLLSIFLFSLPPHIDNEETGVYVHSLGKASGIEWAVVRPANLIDEERSPFDLHDKPQGNLFLDGTSTRQNVANAMVLLLSDKELWEKYKFCMPTIYDRSVDPVAEAKKAR
jgi:nucleoside-diphosphate-sugar epimerase